jgi:hypothetical protein
MPTQLFKSILLINHYPPLVLLHHWLASFSSFGADDGPKPLGQNATASECFAW